MEAKSEQLRQRKTYHPEKKATSAAAQGSKEKKKQIWGRKISGKGRKNKKRGVRVTPNKGGELHGLRCRGESRFQNSRVIRMEEGDMVQATSGASREIFRKKK